MIYKRPLQTDTLLANNSQCGWKLPVSVCTPCCRLLGVVGQSLKPVKLFANRRNIVNCCVRLDIAVSVSSGASKAFSRLCSGELCMPRHNESYRESDSFALNQKDIIIFLKNLFGTKRTFSVDSDTILYYKLFRFFPSLFSTARHFQSLILRGK